MYCKCTVCTRGHGGLGLGMDMFNHHSYASPPTLCPPPSLPLDRPLCPSSPLSSRLKPAADATRPTSARHLDSRHSNVTHVVHDTSQVGPYWNHVRWTRTSLYIGSSGTLFVRSLLSPYCRTSPLLVISCVTYLYLIPLPWPRPGRQS